MYDLLLQSDIEKKILKHTYRVVFKIYKALVCCRHDWLWLFTCCLHTALGAGVRRKFFGSVYNSSDRKTFNNIKFFQVITRQHRNVFCNALFLWSNVCFILYFASKWIFQFFTVILSILSILNLHPCSFNGCFQFN